MGMTRKIINLCTFLTAILFSTSSIASNSIPNGFSCQTVECKIKIKKLKKYARNGSSAAQEIVAAAYLLGEGLEQNSNKAISYLKKSLKQGSGRSAWLLFSIYHFGMGVDKDEEKAQNYLDFAINKKEKIALLYQGTALLADDKSTQEALNLLTEASNRKERNATYLLADYYSRQPTHSEKEKGAMLFLQLKVKQFKDSADKYDKVMAQLPSRSKEIIFQQNKSIERISIIGRRLPISEQLDLAIASLANTYDSPSAMSTRIRGNHKSTVKVDILSGDALQGTSLGRMFTGGNLFSSP
jgi:hypothetical protein